MTPTCNKQLSCGDAIEQESFPSQYVLFLAQIYEVHIGYVGEATYLA